MRAMLLLLLAGALLAASLPRAEGHAFPERAEPRVGAVVRTPPRQVQIWFDGDLEPAFSRVSVKDARGQQVDAKDPQVDAQNRRLLRVSLPALAPGRYTVTWSVLSVDGHRTQGDYAFTLKGAE